VANFEGCNIHDNEAPYERGGGLYVIGTATLTNTNVYSNEARYGGGGLLIDGTATLTNTNVYSNQAPAGGGLFILGTATLTNTNVYSNQPAGVCSLSALV